MTSVLEAEIGTTDVSRYCRTITWKPVWNILDSAIISVPSSLIAPKMNTTDGLDELHLYLDSDLVFSGPCWYKQAEGDADMAWTEITGWDHRIWLAKRLCKTGGGSDGGNLITPGSVILDNVTAPEILGAFIQNAIDDDDASASEPLPLELGYIDTGGADVTGVPMSFPMSIERMRALLTGTGQLDQVLYPGIGSSTLDLLNDYANDLSGSVVFEYATGAHNAMIATKTVDMDEFWTAIWYLLGPRVTDERWRGSITPTAPHPGGTWPTGLSDRWEDGRTAIGYAQKIDVFDDKGDENSIRPLYEEEYANEAWIAAVPRTFLSVRPQPGIAPTNFGVGDLIGVACGSALDGGTSGAEHVYGFTLSQDTEQLAITEILTSADQVGATGAVP